LPPASFHPSPSKPKLRFPAGACDSHVHVFGPVNRFPYAEPRPYTPAAEAPKEKLFAMHEALGVEHCVIVHAGCHGRNNAVTEDALIAKQGKYCGIALLPTDVPDAELRRLDKVGFRGVRFNYMSHLGTGAPIDEVLALAERLAPIGWHLQVHMESTLLFEILDALKRAPVPVVVDHMGRVDASLGLDLPGFKALTAAMKDPKFWVKVSGSERITRRKPRYADALPFARALVAEFGDRVLWGTDWPHPNLDHVPDDGLLADLVTEMAPTEAERTALLVDNPRRLYRFASIRP
jgi:2-pyrone-4,6-dicarboxylate lactonase